MEALELIGLRGLAHLLNLSMDRSTDPDKVIETVVDVLAEFLGVDKYALFRRINDARVKLASGEEIEQPHSDLREDLRELSELLSLDTSRWIGPVLVSASLLGSFYTGARGVPLKVFGYSEPMSLITLSAMLSRLERVPEMWLELNDGLAVVYTSEEKPGGLLELSLKGFVNEVIANTLYISRVFSSPSDTFLHGVLGVISFSPGLSVAAKIAEYLRDLNEKEILDFLLIIGFYLGVPGLKKKIRKLQYEGSLFRSVPITHDVLLDALNWYKEKGKELLGELYLTPMRLIERSLNRSLTHSEAKALALTMIIDLSRSVLSRVVTEDTLKIILSDALSALYKSLSFIYRSDQAHNIPTRLVREDGLRRLAGGENTPLYKFLREQFDAFDVKYMDDVLFELPFRLRLLKRAFGSEGIARVDASVAMSFIAALGAPVRGSPAQKLLAFLADAMQSGRLSSVEIFYDRGRSRIKYSRSTRIESTRRILETSFPSLEEMFFFSRLVRGILDRNSLRGRTERSAYEAEKLSKNVVKAFIKLRKKYFKRYKRFDILSKVHPLVLFSLPLALVTSYYGESLSEILEHIDFESDDPSKAMLYVSRGDAEELFSNLRSALGLKPSIVDRDHVQVLKALAANGLAINYREEVGENGLRPYRLHEILKLLHEVRPSFAIQEALFTIYNIGKRFGYVSVYGEAETVVTLNCFQGGVGLINSTLFQDVAANVAHRDVMPFDHTLFYEAMHGRVAIRDERSLQEFFGSFFRFLKDGYAPMIATDGDRAYIRLLNII